MLTKINQGNESSVPKSLFLGLTSDEELISGGFTSSSIVVTVRNNGGAELTINPVSSDPSGLSGLPPYVYSPYKMAITNPLLFQAVISAALAQAQ